LGVRAAAVLGGTVLALAGLYFFRYSIEHGLIPPWLRVVIGTLAGLACLVAAEWRLRARNAVTANALSGAGIAILYAAFWAARTRYDLIGPGLAFAGMAAVTAACTALAARHASLVIAAIGLLGGFATPLLISSGSDRPIGLFGYLLVLDTALLVLAQRRRWPVLAATSLLGTSLYQVLWIGSRMRPEQLWIGLAILGVFAVLFAFAFRGASDAERRNWAPTHIGAVLLPFAFALYLARDVRFGPHFAPIASLLVLLALAASHVAARERLPWVGIASAAASLAVAAIWLFGTSVAEPLAWEGAACVVAIALAHHLSAELRRGIAFVEGPALAAAISAGGAMLVWVLAPAQHPWVSLWPWLAAWLGLAALLLRQAELGEGRAWLSIAAASGLGLGLIAFDAVSESNEPAREGLAATGLALAAGFQVLALWRARSPARLGAEHGAAALAALLLVGLCNPETARELSPTVLHGASLALGLLIALAATRLGHGAWTLAGMALAALAQTGFAFAQDATTPPESLSLALALQALAVALFTAWPFIARARLRADPWTWIASALAAPLWFLSLRELYVLRFGDAAIGLLPIALAVLGLAAAAAGRRVTEGSRSQQTALVWQLGAVLAFVTVAIPLQLSKEWLTIGWALEGFALALLWRRIDHVGLKFVALALLGAVAVRLVENPAVLEYHERGWPIANWLLYTYLVPAAAMLGAARALAPLEVARKRPFEEALYGYGRPVGAIALGAAAIVVNFVWLNLAVFDAFSVDRTLRIQFERAPARDLSLSIAWALYALALLAVGIRRGWLALRWTSLVLVLATVLKVFLYDLGELRDLWRVASLVGLGLSLIVVSLAYQRLLRRTPTESP